VPFGVDLIPDGSCGSFSSGTGVAGNPQLGALGGNGGPAWPTGSDWVLQPKYDGFRLLVAVDPGGRVRAWSRHGTSLTARLAELLAPFAQAPAGSVFDGELVAIVERDGRPVQDFAAVARGTFAGDQAAAARLRFVAFDLLGLAGEDLRRQPWHERDHQMREAVPTNGRISPIRSMPASLRTHEEIVALGFEGTLLKRPRSPYRPGRNSAWVKHKARLTTPGTLLAVRQNHEGQWYAICERRLLLLGSWSRTSYSFGDLCAGGL
jgi:DNA ligase-1